MFKPSPCPGNRNHYTYGMAGWPGEKPSLRSTALEEIVPGAMGRGLGGLRRVSLFC